MFRVEQPVRVSLANTELFLPGAELFHLQKVGEGEERLHVRKALVDAPPSREVLSVSSSDAISLINNHLFPEIIGVIRAACCCCFDDEWPRRDLAPLTFPQLHSDAQ